jgi:membrane protease YdiL (CAAX protease family)
MNILEIIREFVSSAGSTDMYICLAGSILLAYWLLKTSLGTKALKNSEPRRNNMPLYFPFVIFFATYFLVGLGNWLTLWLVGDLNSSVSVFLDNLIFCIIGLITAGIIIILVRPFFARGLKGFGLNLKTIHKDFLIAFVNLLAIWPIVMVAVLITMHLGEYFYGPEYEMQRHQGLETLSEYQQLLPRIFVSIVAIIVAPLLEELLFRGLFQTMIRSVLNIKYAAWLSIAISSGLFVMMHVDYSHWPALYVLGVGLGYSYEKSGSLFRPIFMHIFFNATSIISVWIQ